MTVKQQRILEVALQLFAKEGYAATSTSRVAKEAQVSEGLIFRHFGNKEGLLEAIMQQGQAAAKSVMTQVVMADTPEDIIRNALTLPFSIAKEQYEMWRLIYALKWQTDRYQAAYQEPMQLVLQNAFAKLGYPDPAAETALVFMFIDGAATALLLHDLGDVQPIQRALLDKYKL